MGYISVLADHTISFLIHVKLSYRIVPYCRSITVNGTAEVAIQL